VDALVSTAERTIARIAASQHGIVTWAEMIAVGLSAEEIRHRVKIGLLIRVHRGVYSVGHRVLTTEAQYLAAVKACGEGALLCGLAAAYLLAILKAPSPPAPEVATRNQRRVPRLKTRRLTLDHRDITELNRIPCTTVPRTIVDLAAVLGDDALARVFHEANVKYGTTPAQVEAVLKRKGNATGARVLRAVIHGKLKVSLSVLEREFLAALKRAGLPLPDTNVRIGNYRVDCRWTDLGITVELDSYRYHRSRYAWEQSHSREREARRRGDEWRRFTYDDVFGDQTYMLSELRKLLA
jgi:predicted transcriptional regulator of viral defense system